MILPDAQGTPTASACRRRGFLHWVRYLPTRFCLSSYALLPIILRAPAYHPTRFCLSSYACCPTRLVYRPRRAHVRAAANDQLRVHPEPHQARLPRAGLHLLLGPSRYLLGPSRYRLGTSQVPGRVPAKQLVVVGRQGAPAYWR
eukprot:2747449-Rhodomonas_salina.4